MGENIESRRRRRKWATTFSAARRQHAHGLAMLLNLQLVFQWALAHGPRNPQQPVWSAVAQALPVPCDFAPEMQAVLTSPTASTRTSRARRTPRDLPRASVPGWPYP